MSLYLDNNATTPLDPRVLETMLPYLSGTYGNPSSIHRYGRQVRTAIEQAREQVASLLGAQASQLIFTSCGTEANNMVLFGLTRGLKPAHLAVSSIEHSSVRETAYALRNQGWALSEVPVDAEGRVSAEQFEAALRDDTVLASVMMANNETGVIQDIESLAEIARQKEVLFHTDATQSAGKIQIDFESSAAQLMTLSSHKLYGPLGAGALVYDKSVSVNPLLFGGSHESGLRAGTENAAAIIGFGAAAELAMNELESRVTRMRQLRDRLEAGLSTIDGSVIFAQKAERLPNTVLLGIKNIHGQMLLMQLDQQGIAVSSGSACRSGTHIPSHVLKAMGVDDELALSAIRISLGKDTTKEEIDQCVVAVREIAASMMNNTNEVVNA